MTPVLFDEICPRCKNCDREWWQHAHLLSPGRDLITKSYCRDHASSTVFEEPVLELA